MAWYDQQWARAKDITIDADDIASNESDFPVLIDTGEDSDLTNARSDGYDFVFTEDDGVTEIPYERHSWNSTTGRLVAWVKLPSISTVSGGACRLYYDNPNQSTDKSSKTAVWSNDYELVAHLHDDPDWNDSTSNNRSSTEHGTVTVGSSTFGAAACLNSGDSDGIDFPEFSIGSELTLSLWVTRSGSGGGWCGGHNLNSGGHGLSLQIGFGSAGTDNAAARAWINGTLRDIAATGAHYTSGDPHFLATKIDPTASKFSLLGRSDGTWRGEEAYYSTSDEYDDPSGSNTALGLYWYEVTLLGDYWEFRLASAARSDGWLETESLNQHAPTAFVSIGPELLARDVPATLRVRNVRPGTMLSIIREPTQEISRIFQAANSSGDLAGTYFLFESPRRKYYVWFKSEGVGSDPAVASRKGLLVDLSDDDLTAVEVAAEVAPVVDAIHEFGCVISGNQEVTECTIPADVGGDSNGCYFRINSPDGDGGERQWVVWSNVEDGGVDPRGVAHATMITTVADVAGSLNETYFDVYTMGDDYRIWFDVDDSGTPPSAGAFTLLEVDISEDDSAATVAAALKAAIRTGCEDDLSVVASGNAVRIENVDVGAVSDAVDTGSTGFTLSVDTEGTDPVQSGLDAMLGIEVAIVGGDSASEMATKVAAAIDLFDDFECRVNPQDTDEIIITNTAGGAVTNVADGTGGYGLGITGISVTTAGTSNAIEITNLEGGAVDDASDGDAGVTVEIIQDGDDIRNELRRIDSAAADPIDMVYLVGDPMRCRLAAIHDDHQVFEVYQTLSQAGSEVTLPPVRIDLAYTSDQPSFVDGTEVVFSFGAGPVGEDRIDLVATGELDADDGVAGNRLYSVIKSWWKTTIRIEYPFPFESITEEQLIVRWPWIINTGEQYLRDVGFAMVDTDGLPTMIFAGIIGIGNVSDTPYYYQLADSTTHEFTREGPPNEPIQVYGDADHGAYDYTAWLGVYNRPASTAWGKTFDHRTLAEVGSVELAGKAYRFPIDELDDPDKTSSWSTVGGWSDITITVGACTHDVGNGNGARPYAVKVDAKSAYTCAQAWQRLCYVTAKGSTTTICGKDGDVYRGAELVLGYDAESAPFNEGSTLTGGTSGATAYVMAVHDDGTTGRLVLTDVVGEFQDDETITDNGGSPGSATVNVAANVTVRPERNSPFGRMAGDDFVGAFGVALINVTDRGHRTLLDSTGTVQDDPTVGFTLTNVVSGTTIYVKALAGGSMTPDDVMIGPATITTDPYLVSGLPASQPFRCLLAKATLPGTLYQPLLFDDTTGTVGFSRRISQVEDT